MDLFKLIIFFLLLLKERQSYVTCNEDFDERIIGGRRANIQEFPHVVVIEYWLGVWIFGSWHFFCGGSILNNWWILTAAHCKSAFIRIIVGVDQEPWHYKWSSHSIYQVDEMFIYPMYGAIEDEPNKFDVAIIKLASELKFSDEVKPIPLYEKETIEFDDRWNKEFLTIGYGYNNEWSYFFYFHLRVAVVVSIPEAYIKDNKYKYYKDPKYYIVAGKWSSDESGIVSTGDSGSPLMATLDGKNYLVGICSVGPKYVKFATYTRIQNYLRWINQTIIKNSKDIHLNPINLFN